MNLTETININSVLEEVTILQKRSELLELILSYYNGGTMTFDIPSEWKNNKILKHKLPAESPRHLVYDKISNTLSRRELINFNDFES